MGAFLRSSQHPIVVCRLSDAMHSRSTTDHQPMNRRLCVLGLPMALGAAWITPAWAMTAGNPHGLRESRVLMGTMVDIVVDHPQTMEGQRAMQAAWTLMQGMAHEMSRYEEGNTLARLHAHAGRSAVAVSPALMQVLRTAQDLHLRTGGLLDITVGSLTGWDFRPGHEQVPSAQEIATQLPLVRQKELLQLDVGRGTAYLRSAGARLDLGAVAKLPILHAGMQTLRAHGIDRAMINGGGDVLVHAQDHQAPWRIGVRDAIQPQRIAGTVSLHRGVVASSGDYERRFERQGLQWHHVLNPRTGYPSRNAHGVVMVAADTAMVNGLGSAIMVAGVPLAQRLFHSNSAVDALVVQADGSLWMTPGMSQRLHRA